MPIQAYAVQYGTGDFEPPDFPETEPSTEREEVDDTQFDPAFELCAIDRAEQFAAYAG